IDVLFRSVAADYGPRVVGVLLSGNLDDGTAGFAAIKQRLGVTIAQDPAEALFPSMPQSAIDGTEVDYVVPLERISELLQRLVAEPIHPETLPPVPREMLMEIEMAGRARGVAPGEIGRPSTFGCPECGGPLNQITEGDVVRFRCHVGHAWSPES